MRRIAFMAVLLLGSVVIVAAAAAETVTNTYTGEGDAATFGATMDGGATITYGAETITFGTLGYDATTYNPTIDTVDLPSDSTMKNGDFVYTMQLDMTAYDGVGGWGIGQGIRVSFGDAADNSMSIAWRQIAPDQAGTEEAKCVGVGAFDDTREVPEFDAGYIMQIESSAEVCNLEGDGAGNISLRLTLVGNDLTASYLPNGGVWTDVTTVDMTTTAFDPAGDWSLSVFSYGYDGTTYQATSHVVDEISVAFTPVEGGDGGETATNTYTGEGDAATFGATMDGGATITYGAETITFGTLGYDATTYNPTIDTVDLPSDSTMKNGDFVYTMQLDMTAYDGVGGWGIGQGIRVSFGDAADNSMSIAWRQIAPDQAGTEEAKCVGVGAFDDTREVPEFDAGYIMQIESSAEVCNLEGDGAGNISLRLTLVGNDLTASYLPNGGVWTDVTTVDMTTTAFDPAGDWSLSVFSYGYDGTTYQATSHVVDEISVTFTPVAPPALPVISLTGDAAVTIGQGSTYTDPGYTAASALDGDLTDSVVVGGDAVDTDTLGTYTVTYDVTDSAENAAEQVIRIVTVVENDAPVIVLTGSASMEVAFGVTYTDAGATATDDFDGDLTADIVVVGDAVDTNTAGTYTITYDVTDSAGNAAEQVTRTVTVLAYVEPGVDEPGENIYGASNDANKFPATMDGGAAITYQADTITFATLGHDGSYSFDVDSVDLPVDTTRGSGDFVYTIDLAMTDLDGTGGWYGQGIAVKFPAEAANNETTVTWRQFSNEASVEENKCVGVNVFDDTQGPSLSGITSTAEVCDLEGAGAGAISLRISLAGSTLTTSYKPVGGDWTEVLSVDMTTETTPDPSGDWSLSVFNWGYDGTAYLPTSHVVDEIRATFTPAVIDQYPVIILVGAEIIYLDEGDTYTDPGATATDNEDGDLTAAIVVGGDAVATNVPGAYEVAYDVEDAAGNAATTVTRWVIVDPVVSDDTDSCFIDSASANSRQRPFPLVLVALSASILIFLCGRMPRKKESKQMKKIQLSLIALLLVIGLVAGDFSAALAQEAEEEKEVFVLEEIVVTSQRREQNVQDVPISMTAMSGEDLEKLHLETTTQLSAQVANLNIDNGTGENTFTVVVIRGVSGMGNTYAAGQAALVYSDDLLLDSYFSHGMAFFDVDRVEVLRGPQGTLFGRNSTSGAIQVISNRPGDELEGYAELTYGRYNRTRFEGAIGGPVSDKVGLRLAAFYDRKDGWYENIQTHDDFYGSDVYGVRGILEFEPTDDIDILLKAQYGSVDQDPTMIASSVPNPHVFTAFDPSLAPLLYNPGPASDHTKINSSFGEGELEDDVEDYQFTLTLNWDLGDMRLTSVTGYTELTWLHVNDWDSTAAAIYHGLVSIEYDGFIQELRLTSEGESAFQWIVGGLYLDANNFSEGADDFTDYYGAYGLAVEGFGFGDMSMVDHNGKSYGVFAHTTYAWADKLATTHAIRYTRDEMERVRSGYNVTMFPLTSHLSYTNISAHTDAGSTVAVEGYSDEGSTEEITWRLAVEYAARDDLLLYASVSRGYRAGLLGGVWDSAAEAFPFVEPESVIAYETGIKSRWLHNRLLVNGAVFYYDYENYQSTIETETSVGIDYADTNVPQVRFAGLELEIVAQPIENLMISLGLGYVDNEIEEYASDAVDDLTGNNTPYAPEMDFNGLIRYDIPVPGFGVLSPQFDWDYIGGMYPTLENVREIGGEWIFNGRLTYRNDRGLSINFFVENIADEKHINNVYAAYAQDYGTDMMQQDRPRTYGITIRYDF